MVMYSHNMPNQTDTSKSNRIKYSNSIFLKTLMITNAYINNLIQ